jgi:hypothetical protein
MSVWNLRRQRIVCAACDEDFADRARYFSLLHAAQEGLSRRDYCVACWSRRETESADLFWWRTRHSERTPRGLALNLEALEALFLALEGRNDLRIKELRFLLCLLLMRKRRLKTVRMIRDQGSDAFVVRRPRRQEEFTVFVFDFTPERMAELREELRSIFAGGATPAEIVAEGNPL